MNEKSVNSQLSLNLQDSGAAQALNQGGDNMKSELSDEDLLCIIIDHDANQGYLRRDPELFTKVVNNIIVLANAHLLQRSTNKLAILGCSSRSVNYIYPVESNETVSHNDAQLEQFATVEHWTKLRLNNLLFDELKVMIDESNSHTKSFSTNLLCGSVSMALAYINRCKREASKAIKINASILIVSGSQEPSIQNINKDMNMFLVAAKMGVAIDVCALEVDTSYTLRHSTEITGGFYFGTNDFDALGLNLLCLFLMPPQGRHQLNYPKQPPTDSRAICKCHNKFIEIGFACSSCLSIFCKNIPNCTFCDTVFKLPKNLQLYIDKQVADKAKRQLAKIEKIKDTISPHTHTNT